MATFFTKGGFKEEAVLTPTFEFLKFPKSIPKKKKTMVDYIKPRKHLKLLKKHASSLRVKVKKVGLPKEKTRWQLIKILDKMYSEYLKKKSKGICFKCGRTSKNAGVSHYFSRKYMGGRWDNDNCDFACWGCHQNQLEHFKQPGDFYYNYMIKKLGLADFVKLEMKVHAVNKFSIGDIKLLIANFSSIWK